MAGNFVGDRVQNEQLGDVSGEESRADTLKPEFNPKPIARMERVLERSDSKWSNFFQETGITPLVIQYEDLVSDYSGVITSVLKWLE